MTEHSADHNVSMTATAGHTDATPIAQHDDQQLAAGEYLVPTVHTTAELRVTDGGTWLVRSTSQTVCHLDLDRMLLLRARGTGSPPLPYDDEWVPLVRITSITTGDTGVVRVRDRHEYLTTPAHGRPATGGGYPAPAPPSSARPSLPPYRAASGRPRQARSRWACVRSGGPVARLHDEAQLVAM